jgi:site-specific DNA-cytosine methylase
MRALVLFKGTGSIDRALERCGFKVDSLDIDPSCNATWTANVLEWEAWKDMAPGVYDFIWASVPCQHYSRARTRAKTPRNLELADSIVERTLEIIRELAPRAWLLENPQTGLLKTRPFMQGYPFRDCCYCRYAEGTKWNYRKATRLWGVLPTFAPRPMCTPRDPCELSAATGKHPDQAQRGGTRRHTLNELYSIPTELCMDIARAAVEACSN